MVITYIVSTALVTRDAITLLSEFFTEISELLYMIDIFIAIVISVYRLQKEQPILKMTFCRA